MSDLTPPLPASVDPLRLLRLLEDCGWKIAGHRRNIYYRLRTSPDATTSLVVPVDRTAADFPDLMAAAIRTLQTVYRETWVREIGPRLATELSDAFRFRKETHTPSGTIQWDQGQQLIAAARATLLAGAKSYMEPARYYSNRFGRFAHRYLDTVLMGQTTPGSYVVTAFAPSAAKVPLHGSQIDLLQYEGVNVASGGEVTRSVVGALEATTEAIEHYRQTASIAGFEDRVVNGVSHEMTVALRDIAADAEGSEIVVEWHSESADQPSQFERFDLSPDDVPILETASTHLVQTVQRERYVATGRVHLLTKKEQGGPGVVGVDDGKQKFRVRLESDEEYHQAVLAHDQERDVEIAGELSREGTLRWLYNARLRRVLPRPVEPSSGSENRLFDADEL